MKLLRLLLALAALSLFGACATLDPPPADGKQVAVDDLPSNDEAVSAVYMPTYAF
ncbi:MAG: hypothetical protein AAGJ79_11465 [Verrucomicrobiota bacterium]